MHKTLQTRAVWDQCLDLALNAKSHTQCPERGGDPNKSIWVPTFWGTQKFQSLEYIDGAGEEY